MRRYRSATVVTVVTLVTLVMGASAGAQPVDLVEEKLQGVREGFFRLGAFYVTPSLQVSTGYDSNAFSTPTAESDVLARVGPGVRLAVPLGGVGFVDVYQEVDYVYYREQVELRRWFDVTRVGAGIGGRRFLFEVTDEFRDETGRPTTEFDFPVRQRSNNLTGTLALALGWRHVLSLGAGQSRYEIVDGLEQQDIEARLNRVQNRGFLDIRRRLTAKTSAVAEGFVETFDYDENTRDSDSYGARFGFEFNPGGADPLTAPPIAGAFLNGRLLLGFRNVQPLELDRVDYTGLVGSVDLTFGFGEGQRLQGLYSRDVVPSIFQDNWYFVENRWGASLTYQMTRRFSVSPGVVLGRNRYPLPAEVVEGEPDEEAAPEIFDDHTSFRLGVDYRITERWTVGVLTDYLERSSNISSFAKDRLQVGLNMSYRP